MRIKQYTDKLPGGSYRYGYGSSYGYSSEDVRTMNREVQVLTNQLRTVLYGEDYVTTSHQKGGTLDTRRFASALSLREDVFKNMATRQAESLAVVFMLDLSGSMSGCNIFAAAKALEVLTLVVHNLGGKLAVRGFRGSREIVVLKDFDDPVEPFVGRWVEYAGREVSGNNPNHEAVLDGIHAIMDRPESRKIVFHMTDGFPNGFESVACLKGMADMTYLARDAGIEVIHLAQNVERRRMQGALRSWALDIDAVWPGMIFSGNAGFAKTVGRELVKKLRHKPSRKAHKMARGL